MSFEHLTDDEIDILENFLKNKSDSWFELFVCTSFLDDHSLNDDSTEQADDLEGSFFFHKVILANKEYVFKWCNQEACKKKGLFIDLCFAEILLEKRRRLKNYFEDILQKKRNNIDILNKI